MHSCECWLFLAVVLIRSGDVCRCRLPECSRCVSGRGTTSWAWRQTGAVARTVSGGRSTTTFVQAAVGRSSAFVSVTTRRRYRTDRTVRTAACSPPPISSVTWSSTATSTFRSSSRGRWITSYNVHVLSLGVCDAYVLNVLVRVLSKWYLSY